MGYTTLVKNLQLLKKTSHSKCLVHQASTSDYSLIKVQGYDGASFPRALLSLDAHVFFKLTL